MLNTNAESQANYFIDNTCSFKYFNILLKQIAASGSTERSEKIIRNENVRGSSAYVGGGIRA